MVTPARAEKIKQTLQHRQQGVVVLEDLYDPHNAGAVFRSCEAFGLQQVYLIFEKQAPFNPLTVAKPSSASASRWLNFTVFHSTEACLTQLKNEGYTLYATCLAEDAVSLLETPLTATPKTALLFGNEHRGLSQTAIEMAHHRVMIPMVGMVQSLNLSVTAAICLYELTRQRREVGWDAFGLPPEEQAAMLAAWLSETGEKTTLEDKLSHPPGSAACDPQPL